MANNRWQMPSRLLREQLFEAKGITPLIAQLLCNRGVTSLAQVEPFLAADRRLLLDPFLLPDMDKAVARVQRALRSGEAMTIYGDFDADGITATTLLTQGLCLVGGKVTPYIPHRIEEGYGLNSAALEKLYRKGVSLVITVDCGISTADEVAQAQSMGLDVIITDHHTPLPMMPPAVAVVDPKRADSAYPFRELAGVGVAFKLLQAVYISLGKEAELDQFLDLVALGTVADMSPLLGENRYLVKRGLEVLNSARRLGLKELMRCSGVIPGSVDPETISWMLGPRLNAAGRLDHAIVGYDLLVTSSEEEARGLARLLEAKNLERQRITEEILCWAREKLLATGGESTLLMVGDKAFDSSVVGIVAGKLADEFYRPTIVFERGTESSRGSGRSIPEFNMIAALTQCRHLLSRFGGHPMAAGFTAPTENLPQLQECLTGMATQQLAGLDLRPLIVIDAELPLSTLQGTTFRTMQKLAPFGQGNPLPTFLTRRAKLVDCRGVGNNGQHLKLKFRDDHITWDGIAFGLGDSICELSSQLDIVYNLSIDRWRAEETLQLNILDFAPSG